MSQTETLLVLALGSALTFVFFLLFGRIFWNIAMAAGARRRARQIPVEMLNLQADRDRLRAEHALMARKLELKLDDIKIRMTEQMAEVSRNRNRVQGLLQEIEHRDDDIKKRQRENDALSTQLQIKDVEFDAAQRTIQELNIEAARHAEEMTKLHEAMHKLGATLRNKDALVGQLNGELRGLLALPPSPSPSPSPSTPAQPDPTTRLQDRLRRRVAELTSISADISRGDAASDVSAVVPEVAAASDVSAVVPEVAAANSLPEAASAARQREEVIQKKMAEAERQTEEMQKELHALDELLANTAPPEEAPLDAPRKQGAMASVVSLAQRIRALQ